MKHKHIHHFSFKEKPSPIFFIVIILCLVTGISIIWINSNNRSELYVKAENGDVLTPTETLTPTITPTETLTPTPTPVPVGAMLSLSFSIPGISSESGNITPFRPKRKVTLYFYDTTSNVADISVKPLYSKETEVTFDDNPESKSYTKFKQDYIDLGNDVPEGKYQIAFKMPQALTKIVKKEESDIGGIIFTFKEKQKTPIEIGNILLGDIVPLPEGDNRITIADYNAFIDCFGEKISSDTCLVKEDADLDDNGVVDGIDYNLLMKTIFAVGSFEIPTVTKTEKPTPTKKIASPSAEPTLTQEKQGSNGSIFLITGSIFFIALLLVVIFNKKVRSFILSFFKNFKSQHLSVSVKEKEYYVTKKEDSADKKGVWLTLADEAGQTLGFYPGTDYHEGFAKVTGLMKNDQGKEYLEITKIVWEV